MAILVRALVVFLVVLILALFVLTFAMLRINRMTSTADAAQRAVSSLAAASRSDLTARLQLLQSENGIARIEVYRGNELFASAGALLPTAEVLTRPLPGGRMTLYFDVTSWIGGRRNALIAGAFATLATMLGLLILILYLPKFVRPIEEMLAHAREISGPRRGGDDASYLVHTFREAVERIQEQARELDHLRDAASSRSPDVRELAGAIHRSFTSGFVAVDSSGALVALNDAGRGILDVPSNASPDLDVLPQPFANVIRESLQTRVAFTRREVVLDGPLTASSPREEASSPASSVIGVTTVPLFEGDTFLGLFALFTDLTKFRAMENRLRDFEHLVSLGQMSAGVAHEFRNSLFAILGYLRLAQRDATPEAGARITAAEDEARRLASAVDSLLNFARPLTVKAQRLRLDELVGDVLDRVAEEAGDVRFERTLEAVTVNGDGELLARALENIVRNAVDSVRAQHPGGSGGIVSVEVREAPHPLVSVRDNGQGLDPAEAPKLLLPFQSTKPLGFGLGLPLAKKIALHHGAELTLAGAPGEGATVAIVFGA